jgi:glyoxylase-like metal-dependent hydrolase (beta-lactamase superfamily II)
MRQHADDLARAATVLFSNVWLLTDKQGRRFLIDTGDAAERPGLALALRRGGLTKPGDLTAVLLTHWHRDHAGSAAWLRRKFQCPVVCHAADAAYLEGTAVAPKSDPATPQLWADLLLVVHDFFPPVCEVDDTFTTGLWKYGFRVFPTPGHTDGTVMLYHEPTRTLFSGDAIIANCAPPEVWQTLRLADGAFTGDTEGCHGATRKFLNDPPPIARLCPGHGPVIERNLDGLLARLAAGEDHLPLWREKLRELAKVPEPLRGLFSPHSATGRH